MSLNQTTDSLNRLTALCGIIGSGKSVVAKVLTVLGYPIYDCDFRARSLMDRDYEIHRRLAEEISEEVIHESCIDRKRLAEIVFADKSKLALLNSIVHGAVRRDLKSWRVQMSSATDRRLFVESAILFESGLDRMVDDAWIIETGHETRIKRVMARNSCSRSEVEARIACQHSPVAQAETNGLPYDILINEDTTPLLPQILTLLADP